MSEPPRVLLVDDDRALCRLLIDYLSEEGFALEAAHDGAEGLARARRGEHALIVLDVMLPGLNGLDVLRELRRESETPVLVLTARGKDVDRIVGLELGADDYLPKPFNPRELLARIRAVLRRPARRPVAVLTDGDLVLDAGARSVSVAGAPLELTTTEFALLEALLRRAGSVASREALSREALGRPFSPFDRSLDVHVSNLRRKLGARADRIRTVRNHGYLYARPG